jgi:hypothetical protein
MTRKPRMAQPLTATKAISIQKAVSKNAELPFIAKRMAKIEPIIARQRQIIVISLSVFSFIIVQGFFVVQ